MTTTADKTRISANEVITYEIGRRTRSLLGSLITYTETASLRELEREIIITVPKGSRYKVVEV